MRTETITRMSYVEFEKLVQDEYGLKSRWSFVADQECGNDSDHRMEFSAEYVDDEEDDKKEIERFLKHDGRKSEWIAPVLGNDLVRRGKLAPGAYLIEVCW